MDLLLKTVNSSKFAIKKTSKNKKITLNLALNYGSKEEIINACKNFVLKRNKEISINSFKNELYTKNIDKGKAINEVKILLFKLVISFQSFA